MTDRIAPRHWPRRLTTVLLAVVALVVAAAPLGAESAASQYQRAFARERAARATPSTPVTTLRAVAKSYEAIVRAHPTSGYDDNALWQAAGLLAFAYQHSADPRDRAEAAHDLTWLKKEYPTSPFVRQVDDRIAALGHASTPDASPVMRTSATSTSPAATTSASLPVAAPASAKPAAVSTRPLSPAAPASSPSPSSSVPSMSPSAPASAAVAVSAAPTTGPSPTATAHQAVSSPVKPASVPATAPSAPPPASAAPAPSDTGTTVERVTHTLLPKGDRITIELTREATYTATRATNPDRIVCDVFGATAPAAAAAGVAHLTGPLVRAIALAQTATGATRMSVELVGNPHYSSFLLYSPFRLVIDIETDGALPSGPPPSTALAPPAMPRAAETIPLKATASSSTRSATLVTSAPTAPAATGTGDYSLARQLGLTVSRVVIDPGHGGRDPGAQANGLSEADLVLDVSLRLEALLLAQPGTAVVLTRRTDDFVPLEERTAIANREHADLFLSIHANASPHPAASGIETYFLNLATTAHAQTVAARENATSTENMGTLPVLLKTIALNSKLAESHEFATMVQTALVGRLAAKSPAKDLGVKQAPFVVLIGAEMPSVLAEISFLTNGSDATLLKQSAYRQRIAQALAMAVEKYQGSLKKVTTVAARAEER